jgi:hypothetical protein
MVTNVPDEIRAFIFKIEESSTLKMEAEIKMGCNMVYEV